MERRSGGRRPVLLSGIGLVLFGFFWAGLGTRFLDRPTVTMIMGIPFLMAGAVIILLALTFYREM